MRVLLNEEPYLPRIAQCSWIDQGIWPCSWVAAPADGRSPVSAFRLRFSLSDASVIRTHVTADERYELYVDGVRVGRGSERGDPRNWFFETYDLSLSAGPHTIVAKTWALGLASLRSQMSLAPGFLFSPDDEKFIPLLGTGTAAWEVKPLPGHEFLRPFPHNFFSVGHGLLLKGAECDWDWSTGGGDGWEKAKILHPGSSATLRNRYAPSVHLLRPATLPPMLEKPRSAGKVRYVGRATEDAIKGSQGFSHEEQGWEDLLTSNTPLEIPANTSRRVILDLEDYVCAYPQVRLRGGDGGRFQLFWAESLFREPDAKTKGSRHEIEGKYFVGYGDVFCPSGDVAHDYDSFYWRSGRYLEIRVQTASVPLVIERCGLLTTRYPLEAESTFAASDPSLAAIMPLGIRALQSSSHDAYIDGPYYEQMMWLGDGVQNTLSTYVLTQDPRLARKLLRLFDASRLPSGLTAARWPARDTLVLPPYSLLWVSIVRDYAFWNDDFDFVRSLLPGVRAVADAFLGYLNADGLMRPPMGWNFIDWVHGWPDGMAPGADKSVSGILNLQLVRTLGYVAELEDAAGEIELAQRTRRKAAELARAIERHFWDAQRGLFADNLEKTSFSEHAQAEAVLCGFISPDKLETVRRTLFTDTGLARTTISYSHYLFDACRKLGRIDVLLQRLDLWSGLPALGLYTTPEGPEPTRSDCHAWGAHPIYHFFASILGIRPASPGFRTVRIEPQLGTLAWARGTMGHPSGAIIAEIETQGSSMHGRITLPAGVTGTLVLPGGTLPLHSGLTIF
ncbi:MAG: alpha-L-rhamnosidase [Rariglobus sp.]|nr:alpha-L-rhamnosidase [Rariglobus sp.]